MFLGSSYGNLTREISRYKTDELYKYATFILQSGMIFDLYFCFLS